MPSTVGSFNRKNYGSWTNWSRWTCERPRHVVTMGHGRLLLYFVDSMCVNNILSIEGSREPFLTPTPLSLLIGWALISRNSKTQRPIVLKFVLLTQMVNRDKLYLLQPRPLPLPVGWASSISHNSKTQRPIVLKFVLLTQMANRDRLYLL